MTSVDKLHKIKCNLIECLEQEMEHLDKADTKELYKAVHMIKNLEETIYYDTIVESMHSTEDSYTKQKHEDEKEENAPMKGSSKERHKFLMLKHENAEHDKRMHALEEYLSDLCEEIAEMMHEALPGERGLVQQKLTALINKI